MDGNGGTELERLVGAVLHDTASLDQSAVLLRDVATVDQLSRDQRQILTSVADMIQRTGARQRALRTLFFQTSDSMRPRRPLSSVVSAVVDDLRESAAERAVDVRVGAMPATAVDPPVFELVLRNLVENAIKHANGTERFVEVTSKDATAGCWICVRDNGGGIRPEDRDAIFEWRHRGPTHGPGTGLGLAIAKIAAARLGGGLELTDDADVRGACFRFHVDFNAGGTSPESRPSIV